jgi:FkbM family methyltransferase
MKKIMSGNSLLVDHVKQTLRDSFPMPVAYASHLKALFQNEIELRLLSLLCDRRLTSIDVGAFTGTYAIGASIFSKNVIAIEPQPRLAEALRRSMPRNVRIVEAALSNVEGSGILRMPTREGGSISRLDPMPGLTEGWVEVPVKLKCMDDLDCGRVGFVKIDAEGHEIEVLEGAVKVIEDNKPTFLIEAEERHRAGSVGRVVHFLQRFDYDGYFAYRGEVRPISELELNLHQDPSLISSGPRSAYSHYVNNFLFVHRHGTTALPRKVPSAWRAIYETTLGRTRISIA